MAFQSDVVIGWANFGLDIFLVVLHIPSFNENT